jgi:hypothetical protein
MADKNFEQKMSERMDDFKLHPSDAVWVKIDAQLRKDKRRRWVFFLLTTFCLLGTASLIYSNYYPFKQNIQQVTSAQERKNERLKNDSPAMAKDIMPVQNKTSEKPDNDKKVAQQLIIPHAQSNEISKQQVLPTVTGIKKKRNAGHIVSKSNTSSSFGTTVGKSSDVSYNISKHTQPVQPQKQEPEAKTEIVNSSSGKVLVQKAETKNDTSATEQLKRNEEDEGRVKNKVADTAVQISAITDTVAGNKTEPQVKERSKKQWQKGIQVNLGLSDVRESPFPGVIYKSATRDAFNQGGVSVPGGGGINTVITNDYAVKNNLQFGVGLALRKPIMKHSWFVTGLQYQFSSFDVVSRQRRDTFSTQLNLLVNDYSIEKMNSHSFHYINIPTEVQWYVAKTTKGSLHLSTGIQHHFHIASGSKPSFINASAKAVFYQPLLSITPVYEGKLKKENIQLGWYFNYGLLPVFNSGDDNNWWQTGLRFQYFFKK